MRQPGLVVHRGLLAPDETTTSSGLAVTTPVRTAFDLGRRAPSLVEAVVAVDALAARHGFEPRAVLALRDRHRGARGNRRLPEVLRLADPRSESPMETRTRLALVLNGLPLPVLQFEVYAGGRWYRLDLAYPELRVAVEYDGGLHRTPGRARRDLERQGHLSAASWKVVRPQAAAVLHRPACVAADVYRELRLAAVTAGVAPLR